MPPHSSNFDPKLPEDHHNLGDNKPLQDFFIYTVATVVILLVLYLATHFILDYVFEKLTLQQEMQYLTDISKSSKLGLKENDILTNIKNDIVAKMPEAELLQQIQIFYECESSVNALTYPGGLIVVSSSLIDKVKTVEGLSFVIGHEVGHVYYRHVVKNFSGNVTSFVIKSLLGNSVNTLQEGILNQSTLKFSRDHEKEADQFGVQAMEKIFHSRDGGDEFFNTILEMKERTPMFSTHPATEERIVTLFSNVDNDFLGTEHGIETGCQK